MPEFGMTADQMSRLRSLTLQQNAVRSYARSTPGTTAANLTQLVRSYPGISPGVAYALAASGQGPGTAAQRTWQAELASKAGRPRPGEKRKSRRALHERRVARARAKAQDQLSGGGFGSIVSGVGKAAGFVKSGIDKAYDAVTPEGYDSSYESTGVGKTVKGGIRTAAVVAQAPLEAGIGAARQQDWNPFDNGGGYERPRNGGGALGFLKATVEQTTAYQGIRTGDLGSGFLPSLDSEAAKAQAEAARKYSMHLVGGHAWTPGRAIADVVFEPDDDGFKILSGAVDAGIALSKFDPTSVALGSLAEARAASKVFRSSEGLREAEQAAGAYRGIRKFLVAPRPEEWRASPQGQRVLEAIGRETDPWSIAKATGMPIQTADGTMLVEKLARTTSADEAWEVMKPFLGTDVRGVVKYKVPQAGPRVFETVPGRTINFDDLNEAAFTADRYLANAKVPLETRRAVFAKYASANTAASRYGAFDATMDAVKESLVVHGLDEKIATEWTTAFKNNWRDVTNYSDTLLAGTSRQASPFVVLDGNDIPVSHPFWDVEMLHSNIPLPDYRQIRRAVSGMAPLVNNKAWTGGTALVDAMMLPWRKLVLARPAWGVRVIAEEQLRIAATGMSSIANHPMSALAWILGNPDSRVASFLDKVNLGGPVRALKNAAGRGQVDATGMLFHASDEYADALYKPWTAITGGDEKLLREFHLVNRGDDLYPRAVAEELARLTESRMATNLLKQENPGVAKEWFWSGDGAALRRDLAENPVYKGLATDRRLADSYIDEAYERIHTVTDNSPELLEAVRTGMLNGKPLVDPNNRYQVTDSVIADVERLVADGAGPNQARVRKFLTLSEGEQAEHLKQLKGAFSYLFDAMMPRPSSYLSRSPAFRQKYWERMEELVPYMDSAARAKVVENLDIANLGEQGQRIASKTQRLAAVEAAGGDLKATLTLEHADFIAKKYGLDETKALLYDLSERSQLGDLVRNMVPFGEAWRELMTTWTKMVWQQPQVLRRAQQVIQGARGSGFFHKDEFGNEVFTYPGSEMLTKALIGVPVPLKGSVKGLNLIGQGMPGIGPAVSVPVAYLLPDKPKYDFIAEALYPFGTPKKDGIESTVLGQFTPSWMQKILTAFKDPDSTRLYGNTVFDVARYLQSTGDYDLQGPDAHNEMNRLLKDAKKNAKEIYIVRGLTQAVSPTAPAPEWLVEDKNGNLTLAWRLQDWYRKKLEETGSASEALDAFLDKFGLNNFLIPQAKSRELVPGAPTTKRALDWARANPEIVEDYPLVYGAFAPTGGEFDSAAYARQFERGEREALKPREMVELANNRIAWALYREAKDMAGPNPKAGVQQALRDYKRSLAEEFPGFEDWTPTAVSAEKQIAELARAVEDPRLRRNKAARGIREYLDLREQVIAGAKQLGYASPWDAEKLAPLRQWLQERGDRIVAGNPAFGTAWDRILSREVD